jgi:RNA polymerase sigma factor (TIGR02999 family)
MDRPRTDPSDIDASADSSALVLELYEELHRLAAAYMERQPKTHTLQPTALIAEAFVRLQRKAGGTWNSPEHFMAVAARAMRNVLVDHARRRIRLRDATGTTRTSLDQLAVSIERRSANILDLDEALRALEKMGEKSALATRVVELHFLCGLTIPEIAGVLGRSQRSVERAWSFGKAWLRQRLR